MVNLIRRFQQPLMIFITILVIIAFAWLYNTTSSLDRAGTDRIGTIYGRDVTQTEFVRTGRKFELARDLGMYELLQDLVGPAMTLDQATENFVWNSMVLRRETERLGIQATNTEVEEFVKAMPVFQAEGKFDSNRYFAVVQNALAPRGFSEDQLEELVRDSLKLGKIKELLASTTAPAQSEVQSIFEQRHQKTDASVIRLKLDEFLKNAQLTEEDIKKAFEERKDSLTTEEKRKVKYVAFTLPKEGAPTEGKEKIEAMQKLADKASDFSVAMAEKNANFEEIAKKMEVPVQQTSEFTASEPPAELGKAEEIARAAFRLTKEEPNSDPVSAENGYYVIQLAETVPPRPLTYEEAKPKLETELKSERAREAMDLRAKEIRSKIETELKAGKSFPEAVKAAGVTPETFPTFSLAEPKFNQPDAREVIGTASELKTGELSEFVPTTTGGLLVYVNARQPVDNKALESEQKLIADSLSRSRREALFQEWMKNRRADANVQVARG